MATATSIQKRLKLEEMKEAYGLTDKQARYVDVTVEEPGLPKTKRAVKAGYTRNNAISEGGKRLESAKIKRAIVGEVRKRGNVKLEMQEMAKDPRGYLKERFIENASDPTVTSVMHASLEAVAKLDGLFTQKVEIEAGEKTRALWVLDQLRKTQAIDISAQPSEE